MILHSHTVPLYLSHAELTIGHHRARAHSPSPLYPCASCGSGSNRATCKPVIVQAHHRPPSCVSSPLVTTLPVCSLWQWQRQCNLRACDYASSPPDTVLCELTTSHHLTRVRLVAVATTVQIA
ncbi:putative GATA zinc finger domain-containing protein 7 [Sesbania bispinosa]|nr:putative GATA zinc finger domain-containing protein 7 [Sesbania bispinosa]